MKRDFVAWLRRRLPIAIERIERVRIRQLQAMLGRCGENVVLGAGIDIFGPEHVFIGSDVNIGKGAWLTAVENAPVTIGNHVMFGPDCALICGNHNVRELGRFMCGVTEKRADDDQPIVIEDDVWLGFRTTILKGVTIGRGAITGAGSVVTKNVPPYAIVAGNPSHVLRFRWTNEQIVQHEKQLYPPELRLSHQQLEQMKRNV